jgi:hypothetical protein
VAAEGGEAPAIAGYLHGWHNGGDCRGLPSKPWVAGSNPAGGVAGPGIVRNVSHDRLAGCLRLHWRGPGPLLDSGLHGGRSSAGRAPGCGPGGRGFESHRSPLAKSPGLRGFCSVAGRRRSRGRRRCTASLYHSGPRHRTGGDGGQAICNRRMRIFGKSQVPGDCRERDLLLCRRVTSAVADRRSRRQDSLAPAGRRQQQPASASLSRFT